MRVDHFDFDLPQDRIALRPVEPRDSARLLVVHPNASPMFEDRRVSDVHLLLRPGDALVVNDTKVISARLEGFRARGETSAKVEITLHRREGASLWRAFARPAKKLKRGDTIRFAARHESRTHEGLTADVLEKDADGEILIGFALAGEALDRALEHIGTMPLPPYIAGKRSTDEADCRDYQTMFATRSGAVAAPTASLHFTPALVAALDSGGVGLQRLTLHVGAGTFLPVKAEDTAGHKMHAEWGEITVATAEALNNARASGGRIVAVGTTCLRLLESAARPDGTIVPFAGETSIFITPGYRFRAVDALLTNFHLPRSTLFVLVAAFSGLDCMKAAYAHAIDHGYRFYSYGDACLLFPATEPLT
ncbi:MAG: tRNA preQ1(34) S-adenosylmethionine ribosyltransferase-isomerase QueA [Thermoanaerobaculia bacterium]